MHPRPHSPQRPLVLVLGAGLQGVTVALALRRAGWRVEMLDRAPAPMMRTSLRGEGKLHLGYVYGNDAGRATADLMVAGALSFAELIDSLLPRPMEWAPLRSEPFRYAILNDSLVEPAALATHYRWVDDAVEERFARGATYAGLRTFERSRPIDPRREGGFAGDVVAAHQTSEIAIDPQLLRTHLLSACDDQEVVIRSHTHVHNVARTPNGFAVTASDPNGTTKVYPADAVVNCLWEGRLAIDATLDIHPQRPCLYRLRCAVHGQLPSHAAHNLTTTFALGPFGDVVVRTDGRVYLSWYPIGLAGMSRDLEPPAAWHKIVADPNGLERHHLARETLAALAERIEALRDVRIEAVTAGIVVAWGEHDIDHPGSELHRRHDIGVHEFDGYLSVDTGKLTTAPLFAAEVAKRLGSPQPRSTA